jgi:hypothetical protein
VHHLVRCNVKVPRGPVQHHVAVELAAPVLGVLVLLRLLNLLIQLPNEVFLQKEQFLCNLYLLL